MFTFVFRRLLCCHAFGLATLRRQMGIKRTFWCQSSVSLFDTTISVRWCRTIWLWSSFYCRYLSSPAHLCILAMIFFLDLYSRNDSNIDLSEFLWSCLRWGMRNRIWLTYEHASLRSLITTKFFRDHSSLVSLIIRRNVLFSSDYRTRVSNQRTFAVERGTREQGAPGHVHRRKGER